MNLQLEYIKKGFTIIKGSKIFYYRNALEKVLQ